MWQKIIKLAAVVIFAALVVIQFYRPDMRNPAIVPAEELGSDGSVPENISAILNRSCTDCHSNRTVYPWYAQIAPVSWYLANHISEGRVELNLSVWNTYSARKKVHKLGEICEQIEVGEMPLNSYLWIHRSAAVSKEESKLLCDWTMAERQRIEAEPDVNPPGQK